jgi:fatty-acyl-CoA synthase
MSLATFLDDVAGRFAGNEALVFEGRRWTYADLHDAARRVAFGLVADGVTPGDRVGIHIRNRPEAVIVLFGAAMAGATAVPLSTFSTRAELDFMVDQAGVRTVLTHDALPDAGERPLPPPASGDEPGLIIYSSGTTSTPKGMVHAHRAPLLQFRWQAELFRRTPETRVWTALPMFWGAGLTTMGATLAAGACWVMQETFDAGEALALMARERVTEPYCLPHQTAALAEHLDWATTDLSGLRCVFGKSAFARHPKVDGDTSWNMPVGYGLSETCTFFSAHGAGTPRQLMKESLGPLLPGNEVKVVDDELCVKGPTLMLHYVGKTPEECFDADGFFRTGDTGFVDDDGHLHFTGRRTEMIKTGGANVSPAELEVALRACRPVKLARIIGVPDPRLDQVVVACITLKDGEHATEDDIKGFLRERVSSYKVPKRVLFFADGDIPMTGSDTKVRDAELLALVQQRLDNGATT